MPSKGRPAVGVREDIETKFIRLEPNGALLLVSRKL